jgi:thioredoxin-like negative regulator of GroEL
MSATLARRYFVRGHHELSRAENEAASESFRAAIDLHPSFVSARIGYAVALARMGDVPRAAQALRAGLGRPASVNAHAAMLLCMGDVLTVGGDFFGAEDAYRQVSEMRPGDLGAAAGMARVYAKLGRYADAFRQLAQAGRPGRAAP